MSIADELSKHFKTSEFACKDCGRCSVSGILIDALETLRENADSPISVLSGYRCPERNREVGGAGKSQHILGQAADIRIAGKTLKQMYELAILIPDFQHGGIGVYDEGFMHVDVRGTKARWAGVHVMVNGKRTRKYVGISELLPEAV